MATALAAAPFALAALALADRAGRALLMIAGAAWLGWRFRHY